METDRAGEAGQMAGASLTAKTSPEVGGRLGGVHRVDGFVKGRHFAVAPNYPSKLPPALYLLRGISLYRRILNRIHLTVMLHMFL